MGVERGSWGGGGSLRESGLGTAVLSTAQGGEVGYLPLKDDFKKIIMEKMTEKKTCAYKKNPKVPPYR